MEPGQAGLQVADYIDVDEVGEHDGVAELDDHDGADDEEEKDEDDLDAVEGEGLLSCW